MTIPANTLLVVAHDQMPGAEGVYCLPERYEDLHEFFIPEADRKADKYAGYSLVINAKELQAHGQPA